MYSCFFLLYVKLMVDGQSGEAGVAALSLAVEGHKHACAVVQIRLRLEVEPTVKESVHSRNPATAWFAQVIYVFYLKWPIS